MITSLLNRVRILRKNFDYFPYQCLQKILAITQRLNIPMSKPRTNKRKIYRDNHPAKSISDFYGVSITVPLLDTLEQEFRI